MADDPLQPPDKKGASRENGNQDLWKYAGLGTQLTLTVAVFAGLGWWLDRHFGWSPWGLLGFGIAGIAVSMYQFLRDALR